MTRPDQCQLCKSTDYIARNTNGTRYNPFASGPLWTWCECRECHHVWRFTFLIQELPLRSQWQENKRRRVANLPEIDRYGREITVCKWRSEPETRPETFYDDSYDTNSPNYRYYQGD
jgi:hypothetical protein